MNKPIIKLKSDEHIWSYITDIEYDIKYLGDRFTDKMVQECIESIEKINKNINGDKFKLNYGGLVEDDRCYFERKDLEYLASINNCQFDTVGYSPWSYYVAYKDIDSNFIRDLYEGWHWYIVELINEDGFVEDSIGGCYIPTVKDLKECVLDNFDIEDFYLVDNMESTYIDVPKIKESKHISYSYSLV